MRREIPRRGDSRSIFSGADYISGDKGRGRVVNAEYSGAQKLLHWSIALLVIGGTALGVLIGWFGFQGLVDGFGQTTTNFIYKYHKTAGVLILGLMVVRLIVRLIRGAPPYAEPLRPIEARLSALTHRGFYVLLFLMPVLGWLATGAGGYPVEFFNWKLPPLIGKDKELSELLYTLHGAVGWTLMALIVLHVAGALKHAIVDNDGVMRRML